VYLAIDRSPLGNFNTFLIKLDLILQKLFNLNFNFIICGDININDLVESYKKNQLDNILHSFNLSSIIKFPTRIGMNSFSTIDNVFIDNSYLDKFDVTPIINGLSDHDSQLLKIQLVQKQNNVRCTQFKRNINHSITTMHFLIK
jgi:hypothetical protein